MFLDALKLYSQRVLSHIEEVLDEAPTPIAGIYRILDELTTGVGTEAGAMGCFMVNSIAELAPYDTDVTDLATSYSHTFQGLLAQSLTRATEQGTLTTRQTPDQLATYVFNVAQGMRIMVKSGATLVQLQAIRDITVKSLQ